jgi:hypothetical protein
MRVCSLRDRTRMDGHTVGWTDRRERLTVEHEWGVTRRRKRQRTQKKRSTDRRSTKWILKTKKSEFLSAVVPACYRATRNRRNRKMCDNNGHSRKSVAEGAQKKPRGKNKNSTVLSRHYCVTHLIIRKIPACPLGLAGLRELIRHRRPPPPAVRPLYSNFDWLEGLASWPATNLILPSSLAAGTTDCLPTPPVFLRPTFPFLLGAACWARPE